MLALLQLFFLATELLFPMLVDGFFCCFVFLVLLVRIVKVQFAQVQKTNSSAVGPRNMPLWGFSFVASHPPACWPCLSWTLGSQDLSYCIRNLNFLNDIWIHVLTPSKADIWGVLMWTQGLAMMTAGTEGPKPFSNWVWFSIGIL